jgi:N-acetylneuraminic acid mutarotase
MVVWGGGTPGTINTGGKYSIVSDAWTAISTVNAPATRNLQAMVWTGTKMYVWGGNNMNTGAVYDYANDSWTTMSGTNAPSAGALFSAGFWTGNRLLVWASYHVSGSNSGGLYNPNTNSWSAISTTNAPEPRSNGIALWNGQKMLIYSGTRPGGGSRSNTGGIYDPSTNSWSEMSTTNAPPPGDTGTGLMINKNQAILWGSSSPFNTGGIYNFSTNAWTPIAKK